MTGPTGPTRPARKRGPGGRFLPATVSVDPPAPAVEPAGEPPAEPAPAPGVEPAVAPPAPIELYLLRHADAGDSAAWPGVDGERPLSKKGRRQAKALARLLKDLGLRVDAVVTSPLVRAIQTARPVAKATGGGVVTDERLGYGFGKRELAAIVRELGPDIRRVVLVGHDPGFTEVASLLAGTRIAMSTGALARIDLPAREVRSGAGDLRWLLPSDAVAR
jgi:phosphohistidine phosphatase